MRKFVLVMGFTLLAVAIFGILFDFGISFTTSFSKNGHYDLSHVDYEDFNPVMLKGQWEYYPDLAPENGLPTEADAPLMIEITNSWSSLKVDGRNLDAFGYGAYRIVLELPAPGNYAISVDNVYTAYEVYINGNKTAGIGTFGTNSEDHYPRFSDTIVPFYSSTSTVDLVFYISNFTHPKSGFGKPPILGLPEDVYRILTTTNTISLFLIGVMCMTALFMLFYYSSSNRDISIIYFSLFCLLISLRTIATNTLITYYFPNIPSSLQMKLEYLTITLALTAFILYFKSAYPTLLRTSVMYAVVIISLVYSLLIAVTPIRIYNQLLYYYFIALVFTAIYWFISLFISWFRKEHTSGIILFGGFVLAFAMINDIIYYSTGMTNLFSAELTAFGLAFFIITNSYEFSHKFLQALKDSKTASLELEKKVQSRTRQLSELNRKLMKMATKDDLTDLWNRNEYQRRCEEETAKYNRYYSSNSSYFAALFIDLDNFKYYNDTFSHEAGDRILKLFAEELKEKGRKSDTIFRMGGDEFVIFLPKTDDQGAIRFAKRILDGLDNFNSRVMEELSSLTKTHVIITKERKLTCSIGIAVHENGFINIERLIQYADAALIRAKEKGKNCYIIH